MNTDCTYRVEQESAKQQDHVLCCWSYRLLSYSISFSLTMVLDCFNKSFLIKAILGSSMHKLFPVGRTRHSKRSIANLSLIHEYGCFIQHLVYFSLNSAWTCKGKWNSHWSKEKPHRHKSMLYWLTVIGSLKPNRTLTVSLRIRCHKYVLAAYLVEGFLDQLFVEH